MKPRTGATSPSRKVDIDNLMRAKAAIYAGFTVLAQSVGVDLADVSRMLIGGSFGQYINVEKAVQIGLLPDLSTSERRIAVGIASSSWETPPSAGPTWRCCVATSAPTSPTWRGMMTYVELSADNSFYDAFTSALFLPHTDAARLPVGQRPH